MAKKQVVRKRRAPQDTPLISWIELSHLRALDILPESFEKARIGAEEGTPVHDLNGEVLFLRIPLSRARRPLGFADVAVDAAVGEPLIGVSTGAAWDPDALRKAGVAAARQRGLQEADKATLRFVAYSFPKIALQFLTGGQEVLMLELYTWLPVPPSTRTLRYEPPSNFERWSFLDEMPDDERVERVQRFEVRVRRWREVFRQTPQLDVLDSAAFLDIVKISRALLIATRELHYSTRSTDHVTCYELRGQETNVWCVAASVQMLLDFYRYEYTQVRLAQELGLGTLANPNGLPYSQDGLVVTVLEAMSCGALNASMTTTPTFGEFVSEINANRPLISFIPGHSRTVAGYTRSFISILGQPSFRGLLVYDPWPPNVGVITRWENFNTSSYRRTFTAAVSKA